jgi:secreted Zn-dependent insulinase-like peptidase
MPNSKFVGSKRTFSLAGIDVRAEMVKFFEAHYSSHAMKLVVYGGGDVDAVEKQIVESFSPIRNTRAPLIDFGKCGEYFRRVISFRRVLVPTDASFAAYLQVCLLTRLRWAMSSMLFPSKRVSQ